MSSIVISGDTSGAITLAAPSVAGTNTATLPAATGTVMVSGNMPAFSAYANANQSFASATYTLTQLQVKEFDTASCFNNTNATVGGIPAYAFLPNVAGYYQVTACLNFGAAAGTVAIVSFYKNGSEFKRSSQIPMTSAANIQVAGTALIYLNGTTDYIQFYAYQGSVGALSTSSGANQVYFQAVMVRAA